MYLIFENMQYAIFNLPNFFFLSVEFLLSLSFQLGNFFVKDNFKPYLKSTKLRRVFFSLKWYYFNMCKETNCSAKYFKNTIMKLSSLKMQKKTSRFGSHHENGQVVKHQRICGRVYSIIAYQKRSRRNTNTKCWHVWIMVDWSLILKWNLVPPPQSSWSHWWL